MSVRMHPACPVWHEVAETVVSGSREDLDDLGKRVFIGPHARGIQFLAPAGAQVTGPNGLPAVSGKWTWGRFHLRPSQMAPIPLQRPEIVVVEVDLDLVTSVLAAQAPSLVPVLKRRTRERIMSVAICVKERRYPNYEARKKDLEKMITEARQAFGNRWANETEKKLLNLPVNAV